MERKDYPITAAVRFLREKEVNFKPHVYVYEEHGGAHHAASVLKIPEHVVIKTLVMATDSHRPFLVLTHGDCEVSAKQLDRVMGVKHVVPCDVLAAQKHTGYLVGGISPFDTRKQMPVYAEATVFTLERIYINGGKRGFLVEMDPLDLRRALPTVEVEVALQK